MEPDSKTDRNFELLRFNYENLNTAVWDAHKISWHMTSIFVPVIFAALGYLAKESGNVSPSSVVVGAAVVAGVVCFWYAFTRVLAGYNGQRFAQLRKIEDMLDEHYPDEQNVRFLQYRTDKLEDNTNPAFGTVAWWLAVFLVATSAVVVIVKILQPQSSLS
ncbi:MAG: hypothetical protein ACYTEL_08495 [Planctomycetota bacterium]|jgi:hypothetical protein